MSVPYSSPTFTLVGVGGGVRLAVRVGRAVDVLVGVRVGVPVKVGCWVAVAVGVLLGVSVGVVTAIANLVGAAVGDSVSVGASAIPRLGNCNRKIQANPATMRLDAPKSPRQARVNRRVGGLTLRAPAALAFD